MNLPRRLICVVTFGVLLFGSAGTLALAAEIVATVNGQSISREELDWQWRRYLRQNGQGGVVTQPLLRTRRDLLEGLIRQEVAWQQATAAGVTPDFEEIAREIATLRRRFVDDAAYARELAQLGLSEAQLRRQVEKTQTIRRWLDEAFIRRQPVTENEVAAWPRNQEGERQVPALSGDAPPGDVQAKIRQAKAKPIIEAFLDARRREATVEIVENP